jgi:hypothetical protein
LPATPALWRYGILALLALCGLGFFWWPSRDEPSSVPEADGTLSAADILPMIPGFTPKEYDSALAPVLEKTDPRRDSGWETEVVSEAISKQLAALGKLLASKDTILEQALQRLVAPEFRAGDLRPATLNNVSTDQALIVKRGTPAPAMGDGTGAPLLARLLRDLVTPLQGATDLRVKFKVFRVERDPAADTTTAYFHSSGRTGNTGIQQNATWTCRWTPGDKTSTDDAPLLLSIQVDDYEEVLPGEAGGVNFVDCTGTVLGQSESFQRQLNRGAAYWTHRIQRAFELGSLGHQGVAIADVNGDGLDDIFLSELGGLPNLLFTQGPDGTLRDVSTAAGVDFMELTHGALFLDLDNDGDQDLVTCRSNACVILENDARGKFNVRVKLPGTASYYSLAAADYDNDADLDVYLCGSDARHSTGSESEKGLPLPYHDANNGGPNLLLRNDGNWKFTDATREVGLDDNNNRFSFAASWEDYDNDGDMDLYVANDFGRNNLYQNDEGHFRDVAEQAGVEDISAGMSVSWADYNNDGAMDVYIGNMFSSAGGRIAYQRQFRAQGSREAQGTLENYQRHARGNTLFQNLGDGTFADVSMPAGVNMGRWAWCSRFVDINNDGLEDLYVANGYITGYDTTEKTRDL